MDRFYYCLLLAAIYLIGLIAFVLLLVKAAKLHEVFPTLLCLLFVVPYALSVVLYLDLAFNDYHY